MNTQLCTSIPHIGRLSRLAPIAGIAIGAMAMSISASAAAAPDAIADVVSATIRPVMAEYKVPGMAVAITAGGQHRVFNFGVASKASGQPVTDATIFEIGSLSKTFTATLGAYAQARGALSLDDKASRYMPALAGSAFDRIRLLELGTYTAGGLPLQVPDQIADMPQMTQWLRTWKPAYAPGTHRRYSNPSIGLFGELAARALHESFATAMTQRILAPLGLSHTWLRVPQARASDYAWGYANGDTAVRVTPGVFDAQAYGIKTTAGDLIRFVELNMDGATIRDAALRRALSATHTGYFQSGGMTQALGWERYAWPVALEDLLAGNAARMVLEAQPVTALQPPQPASPDVLINKTGSTNGFGAYAAFVPGRRIGIVLLANRNLPIPARVEAAYRILQALDGGGANGSAAPAR
jgi:beta-lactamase class C